MKKYDAIWLTGQPASGKTTLANLLIKKLPEIYPDYTYFNIDGDEPKLDTGRVFQGLDLCEGT